MNRDEIRYQVISDQYYCWISGTFLEYKKDLVGFVQMMQVRMKS